MKFENILNTRKIIMIITIAMSSFILSTSYGFTLNSILAKEANTMESFLQLERKKHKRHKSRLSKKDASPSSSSGSSSASSSSKEKKDSNSTANITINNTIYIKGLMRLSMLKDQMYL